MSGPSQKGSMGTLQKLIDFASLSKLVCVRFGACSTSLRSVRFYFSFLLRPTGAKARFVMTMTHLEFTSEHWEKYSNYSCSGSLFDCVLVE